MKCGLELPAPVRRFVGEAWATRTHVEESSVVQFQRLAAQLAGLGAPTKLVEVAVRAAKEEARHQALCAELAFAYGVDPGPPVPAAPLAPDSAAPFEACLYAAVAHCCVAETESVATLTELLQGKLTEAVRAALLIIARDEIEHAQLGWAIAAWGAAQRSLSFLGRRLPAMLGPGAGALLRAAPEGAGDPRLREHGVLPFSEKRRLFDTTFEEVLLPGLQRVGVDVASARAWRGSS